MAVDKTRSAIMERRRAQRDEGEPIRTLDRKARNRNRELIMNLPSCFIDQIGLEGGDDLDVELHDGFLVVAPQTDDEQGKRR